MSSKAQVQQAPVARRESDVLSALDSAKTQWYHATAVIIAGMGFFTDAYDLFCISTVTKLLGRLYYYDPSTGRPGVLPPVVYVSITGVALVGALMGQLFFGRLGDMLGRKKVYGITLVLMIACSIGSAMSFGHSAKAVMFTLCWFRFWLGVGIGGDYPLSATIMSEYSNTRTRGSFIAAVFAMQGFGILFGGVVAMAVSASLGALSTQTPPFNEDQILSTPPQTDFIWRLIFAIGAIPAAMTLYWRMKMPETARYTALVEGNMKQAAADMATVLNVEFHAEAEKEHHLKPSEQYGLWSREFTKRHGLHLVGTTVCWFMLDVAYYSQNLFQKDVLTAVGWLKKASTMHAAEEVFNIAQKQALLALFTTVPGYWFTVALIDRIGRFKIQLGGFFFMTVFMLAASIPYKQLRGERCTGSETGFCDGHVKLFVVLYGLTFFFSNFGPNSTTFIVPAEIFPARVRSTCHGISAAAGKLGAIVGSFGFLLAAQDQKQALADPGYKHGFGTQNSLIFMAGINAIGLLFTFFVPETRGLSLEELSGENEDMGFVSSLPHSTTSVHSTGTKDTIFDSPRVEV